MLVYDDDDDYGYGFGGYFNDMEARFMIYPMFGVF